VYGDTTLNTNHTRNIILAMVVDDHYFINSPLVDTEHLKTEWPRAKIPFSEMTLFPQKMFSHSSYKYLWKITIPYRAIRFRVSCASRYPTIPYRTMRFRVLCASRYSTIPYRTIRFRLICASRYPTIPYRTIRFRPGYVPPITCLVSFQDHARVLQTHLAVRSREIVATIIV